jgi:hypothetical protein
MPALRSRFLLACAMALAASAQPAPARAIGEVVDDLHGVKVYFNGAILHSSGRHLAPDGYNLGIRYQCVEFAKRYYFERFGHEMPDARGNAKDFFDPAVADGAINPARGLLQFRNGSTNAPRDEDILVLGPGTHNPYGHIAIVSRSTAASLEVVQQNPGPTVTSRRTFDLLRVDGGWKVDNPRVLGWLRLPPRTPAKN